MAQWIRRIVAIALVFVVALGAAPAPSAAQSVGDVDYLVTASWLAQLGADPNIVVVDMRMADIYA